MSHAAGSKWKFGHSGSSRSLGSSGGGNGSNRVTPSLEERDEVPKGSSPSKDSKETRHNHRRFGKSHTFVSATTSQLAVFSDGGLWEAAFEGDEEKVKLYAQEPYYFPALGEPGSQKLGRRGDCERGAEGETILHVAVLRKNFKLAEWIIKNFPSLINEVYLKHRYFGETALHIAVVNSTIGDITMVKLLVENGAKVNGPLVTDSEFLKDEDKGCLYFGQTILQFAATTHKDKILRYLVENIHDPADLTAVDIYGNNVLHIMAYYGDFNMDVFQYLKHRNKVDVEVAKKNGKVVPDLMRARNKDNLTPFQVGISRGHGIMIEAIKELEWSFGNVRHYRVCIDDMDPIQPHQEVLKNGKVISSSRVSKSALEIAADRQDKAVVTHPLFHALLNVKWALYARKKFLVRFVFTVLLILCLTIAISLQPLNLADRRSYFNPPVDGNKYPIVRLVFEGITALGILGMLVGEIGEFVTQGFAYFVGYGAGENVVQWTFSLLVLFVPVLRWGVAAAVAHTDENWLYIQNAENVVLAFAVILGWIYLLNFSKGFKSVGPLIVVFKKILSEDLVQWLALYVSLTLGFSAALFLQMNLVPSETQNEAIPAFDWNNYLGSVLWVIRYLFAQAAFDDLRRAKVPGFAEFLFIAYGFLVLVLLINVLIAKLVETFKDVAKESEAYWAVQFAYLIIDTDEKLSDSERHFLLRHVGWHQSAFEGGSIVTSRYFLFTERDVPDPDHPEKIKTETVKLVVARDHDGKDIEIRTDVDYWYGWVKDLVKPFNKMRRDHEREDRQLLMRNLWTNHDLSMRASASTEMQKVNTRVREYLVSKKDD